MINFLLPLALQPQIEQVHVSKAPIQAPTYATVTKKRLQKKAAVVVKSGSVNKVEAGMANNIERDITKVLSENKIEATLHAAIPRRNGDIIMMFDDKDNVNSIAENIKQNLGMEAHGRGLILPKMTITHVPQYINLDSDLEETIVHSNSWLQGMMEKGETFSVLFSYKNKDFGSIVCKVSSAIRQELARNNNKIKLGMRSCPIKDRVHVLQCGKCLRYNHKTANCKFESHTCAWCTEDHKSSECPNKNNSTSHKCANCQRIKEADIKHHAYDHVCPLRIKVREQLIERTDWGDWPPM